MLVITVKEGEDVVIGDPEQPLGVLRVSSIRDGGKVRLSFEFPRDIPINRREVADLILMNRRATGALFERAGEIESNANADKVLAALKGVA